MPQSYLDLTEYNVHRVRQTKAIGVFFDVGSSHKGLLEQVVQKLVVAGFATEREIKTEWLTLLQVELQED